MVRPDQDRPQSANPWTALDQLQRDLSSLLGRGAGPATTPGGWRGVFPPVNLYETSDAYVMTSELAGVEPDEINVSLEDSTLTIHGERKIDAKDYHDANLHRRERRAGQFRRAFVLPGKVDAEKVEAIHKNGVLMLRVPKSPEAQPRQIPVQSS